jgi:hypothetical protein
MYDHIESRRPADGRKVIHYVVWLSHTKAQPLMWWHDQQGAGSYVARHLRLPDRFGDALAANPGDDGQPAFDFIDDNAGCLGALVGGQCEYFAGVAVGDEPADAFVTG